MTNGKTHVAIVGAGMAGLAAALRLSEREDFQVTVVERSPLIGGKWGGVRDPEGLIHDFALHYFGDWFLNFWQIVRELRLEHDFDDRSTFAGLDKGQWPHPYTMTHPASPLYAWHNLLSGVAPIPDIFLWFYSTIDLISQDYSRRSFLDQFSVNAFIQSREYATEAVALLHNDQSLNIWGLSSFNKSAMTHKNYLSYVVNYPDPVVRVLNGTAYEKFHIPLKNRLAELGCDILCATNVTEMIIDDASRRVEVLRLKTDRQNIDRDDSETMTWIDAHQAAGADGMLAANFKRNSKDRSVSFDLHPDYVIFAVPPGDLSDLITEDVFRHDPDLAKVRRLDVRPLASLDILFNRKIDDVPQWHTVLRGSKFDLTFVDLSQMWGMPDNTYLNVVSSGSYELRDYSDEFVIELMLKELRDYIPFRDSWISGKPFLQQHLDQPIFLADVGSWRDRPKAPTNIPNMFLCGSYCRSEIDTITVEGAINTGLQAAEAIRQACGSASPPIENLLPEKASSMEMLWWKMWLAPYAVGAKMWSDYLNLIKG